LQCALLVSEISVVNKYLLKCPACLYHYKKKVFAPHETSTLLCFLLDVYNNSNEINAVSFRQLFTSAPIYLTYQQHGTINRQVSTQAHRNKINNKYSSKYVYSFNKNRLREIHNCLLRRTVPFGIVVTKHQ